MHDKEFISDFPAHKKKIKFLLGRDNDFREVAEDYIYCKKTLEKLKQLNKDSLAQQYSETLEDLKLEILDSILKINYK